RQFGVDQLGLGHQERVVERDVVRHQGAPAQDVDQVVDDVGELRLTGQHVGGEAVDVGGARVDTGVEQGGDTAFDVAVVADRERGDADDPGLPGPEPRRLHVDDGPSGARLRSRAAPTLWSPTLWSPALWSPALPHTSRMTRGTDNPRIAAARVGF